MNAPHHDHPFAVWTVFRGAPQWWFARGCPPTIAAFTGWQRLLRATVLLGATSLTGVALAIGIVGAILSAAMLAHVWIGAIFGAVYGTVALVPISRWIGRPWWLSLASPIYSMAVFWQLDHVWDWCQVHLRDYAYRQELVWLTTMAVLGLALGAWMISPRDRRTWIIPLGTVLAAAAGAVAYEAFLQFEQHLLMFTPATMRFSIEFLMRMQPLVLFLTLCAAALSVRFVAIAQADSPCPAANTADTGTAKPSSSTEVAVSPDLNSP